MPFFSLPSHVSKDKEQDHADTYEDTRRNWLCRVSDSAENSCIGVSDFRNSGLERSHLRFPAVPLMVWHTDLVEKTVQLPYDGADLL